MARIKQPISTLWVYIWGFVGVATLVIAYEYISVRQHQKNSADITIPSFSQLYTGFKEITQVRINDLKAAFGNDDGVQATFWSNVKTTWIYQDFTATYSRLIQGMFLGCLSSMLLGIMLGCYEWLAALCLPILSFFAKVPGSAMIPVFFVMVGTGEHLFIAMIAFGIMPTLTQAIYLSAKHDLHVEEINKAYTLGASNSEVIWNVVYPQILPKILENIRLQLGPAMVYLLAAEMLYGSVGLGYQIRMQQRLQNMAVVYNYIVILGGIGLFMDRGMLFLRRWLCPWYSRFR